MTPSLNTCLPISGGKSFILGVSVPALLGIVKQLFSTPIWVCLVLVVVIVAFLFLDVILYPRSSMVLILAVICLKLSWINGFLQLMLGLMMKRYFICIGEKGIYYCGWHWSRAVAFSFDKRIWGIHSKLIALTTPCICTACLCCYRAWFILFKLF